MYENKLQWAIAEANRQLETMTIEELKQFTFDRLVNELLEGAHHEYQRDADPGDEQPYT